MRLPRKHSGRPVVGLDIEPGAVTAVLTDGSGRAVVRAASAQLPVGAVREGEVADPAVLGEALGEFFEANRLTRNVRVGVANQRIVMRTLDLPPMNNAKEIASAVKFSAADQIPMPLDEAVLEHRVLGVVETAEGPRTRVLLVAARRDMVHSLLNAIERAGLCPVGVDLSAFAMIRALHDPQRSGVTLYAGIGGITNLALADGATCLFTRSVLHGTDSMAGELAARVSLDIEACQALLRRAGIDRPLEDSGDAELVLEARRALMSGVTRIVDEIRNTVAFHSMQQPDLMVERAVLTGSALGIDGVADVLAAEIGLPTEIGVVEEGALCAFGGVEPTGLTVAAGLTVEEVAT